MNRDLRAAPRLPGAQVGVLGEGRLRVGLDGRNLLLAQGTGIATYARNLAGGDTEWLLDRPPGAVRQDKPISGRVHRYARALVGRWWPLQTRIEGNARIADDAFRLAQVHFDVWRRVLLLEGRGLPDVMHWTSPLPLRLAGIPNLYTLMDTIPLDYVTTTRRRRFLRLLQVIAGVADHVVTISEAACADALRWVPNLAGRISVVSPGVGIDPVGDAQPALHTLGLQNRAFYLFVGSVAPHKNVVALARAFLATGSAHCLVLAGPVGERAEFLGFEPAIAAGRIRRVGYLPRETLIAVMQTARALLFPSLAEGFGLPIIEAMALGTPVMTSDRGAMREVAGGAALLVDPTNLASLQAGIMILDRDEGVLSRLTTLGLARAAAFSLDRQTAAMGAIYRQLMAQGVRKPHR